MDKNSILNIGKGLFNDIKNKLLEQGKETVLSATDEIMEKSKDAIIKTANDKVLELSEGKLDLSKFLNTSEASVEEIDNQDRTNNEDLSISKKEFLNKNNNESSITPVEIISSEDEKYKNSDEFEKGLHKNLDVLTIGAARNPAEAAMVLKELITMAGEVSKFTEVQKTKRKEIEAERDKYVTKINAQKAIMIAYLEKSFDERKANFEKLFAIVDHAIVNNNMQQLAMGLESINNLAVSSPFKDLASIENTQNALNDKDHIWDI
ncbi:hypothetical protein [Amniculibacterium aquaticum]|uniref:hypothetical protein n=1 Tax=Amniculibacterium aquaticum TaxID=2479858 RepID=UPI0019D16257|nr:hypothetical protein [Amniculibacterium aquaticum]